MHRGRRDSAVIASGLTATSAVIAFGLEATSAAAAQILAPHEVPEWSVASSLTFSIGGMGPGEDYQLLYAEWAFRLSDDRLVIGNSGTRQIRFYDAEGRYLAAFGREGEGRYLAAFGEGEGPGEFRGLRSVARVAGDTVVNFDPPQGRVTYVSPDGELVRTFRLGAAPLAPYETWPLGDGTVVVRSVQGQAALLGAPDGSHAGQTELVTHGPDGAFRDRLGPWPGGSSSSMRVGPRG